MTMWFTKLFRQLSGFIGSFSQPVPNPTPEDAELGGITFEQAMSNPLKYSGYPEFSKFLAAEPNFPMVRRFDKLGVRAILRLQDEIRTIEQAIDHIDDEMMKPNGQANNNGTFRHDRSAERQRLIWRASAKLDRYYRFVHLYAQLRDWPSPTDRDLKSVRGWVDTRTHWEWQSGPLRTVKPQIRPIEEEEIEFLEAPDLLAIVPEKRSALRRLLERNDRSWLARLFRKEIPRSLKSNTKNNPLVVTDDKALERFDRLVTGFIGLAMLIAPLWIIGSVRPYYPKVGVITCFIFVCLVLVRTGTNAKPSEALGVTAGYAAVLMVLLQVKKGDY